jgi:hypothetical protein
MWRKVTPRLSEKYTLVIPDLRGYGDSSKPPDGENHSAYSKRAMARDQVELMTSLGFSKFASSATTAVDELLTVLSRTTGVRVEFLGLAWRRISFSLRGGSAFLRFLG